MVIHWCLVKQGINTVEDKGEHGRRKGVLALWILKYDVFPFDFQQ